MTLIKKESNLLNTILEFNNRARLNAKADKKKNRDSNAFYEERELVFNSFKRRFFPLKLTQGQENKILIPSQMLINLKFTL